MGAWAYEALALKNKKEIKNQARSFKACCPLSVLLGYYNSYLSSDVRHSSRLSILHAFNAHKALGSKNSSFFVFQM